MTLFPLTLLAFLRCSTAEKLGLSFSGETVVEQVTLLVDETWVDSTGQRHVNQEIFESVFSMIEDAEEFILLDFFLLNDFLYEPTAGMRSLSGDLTKKLVEKRRTNPEVKITFISDPINTLYEAIDSTHFIALETAGIHVVWTDLNQFRDSNLIMSTPWRLLVKPWGLGPGKAFKNPMGDGRISIRSFLKLLNFKANHRKVVITDQSLLVTSANPHSGSSSNWNVALRVEGAGMLLACEAESAILRLSGEESINPTRLFEDSFESSNKKLEVLTERKIKDRALDLLARAGVGARIDLSMFYFSDRDLTKAFVDAKKRGCDIRIILDPNKDAFGRIKNGIPNRQTAGRLVKAGIPLRWADTHGEQCHVKMLYVEHADQTATLLLGSGNYTRRNMDNLNAECDLALTMPVNEESLMRACRIFDRWWTNPDGRIYTTIYETYEDGSVCRKILAWLMERSGMGTF